MHDLEIADAVIQGHVDAKRAVRPDCVLVSLQPAAGGSGPWGGGRASRAGRPARQEGPVR
jgi:hypothetical protein